MQFTVPSEQLTALLQHISKVVTSNPSNPVLSHFLMEIKEGVLKVTGADKQILMSGKMDLSSCDGDLSFTVAPENILNYIAAVPSQPIVCEVEAVDNGRKMKITHQGGFSEFMVGDAALYPTGFGGETLPDHWHTIEMRADRLLEGLTYTLPVASPNMDRPIFAGIYFDATGEEGIVLVGTDTTVLSKYTDFSASVHRPIPKEGVRPIQSSFSLISKASSILKGMLSPYADQLVEIHFDSHKASFSFGNYEVVSLLNEGVFPNYNSVIPATDSSVVILDKQSFAASLKRICRSVAQEVVTTMFEMSPDRVDLQSQILERSSVAKEWVNAEVHSSLEGHKLGLNARILLTLASVSPGERISLQIADQTRSVLVSPVDMPEGTDLRSIVMPIRISNE